MDHYNYYQLLIDIKKLKIKELKQLDEKLIVIRKNKVNDWKENNFEGNTPVIDINDIQKALIQCIYHFKGGMLESLGLETCPCNCYCENCELIPEHPIGVRMQELGKNITEENVFKEFKEKYGKQKQNEINGTRQADTACNTNNLISDC